MTRFLAAIALLTLCIAGNQAHAAITIGGVPVHCVDIRGIPVTEIADTSLNDVGSSRLAPNLAPIMVLNPNIMNSYGPDNSVRLFWYGHECGHHTLGHLVFGMSQFSEMQADCWSIKVGRDQGWFALRELTNMGIYFLKNPGDPWGHLPGRVRVNNFARCFTDSMTPDQYRQAIISKAILY